MPRFDVYAIDIPNKTYVVDVQADLLDHLATRVVAPLLLENKAPKPMSELNPVFDIQGRRLVMVTQAIGSVPAHELRNPLLSLRDHRDVITRALDILLVGF